jgi:hypothetical protein
VPPPARPFPVVVSRCAEKLLAAFLFEQAYPVIVPTTLSACRSLICQRNSQGVIDVSPDERYGGAYAGESPCRATHRPPPVMCSIELDRSVAGMERGDTLSDEVAGVAETVETIMTPFGQASRCTGVSKTTGRRCGKAARQGEKTCAIHGTAGSGYWSRDGYPEDPRLFASAGGAYRADASEVVVRFLLAQERALRIRRQAAEVDAISTELVRGLVEGMLDVLARYVPREREVEALDALYAWQASLLPGMVRL